MTERLKDFPKIFADTSKIPDIEIFESFGILSGITTNPLIVAKEVGSANVDNVYRQIAERFSKVPVSVQLLDLDVPTLIAQAKDYSSIAPNIIIKVPMFGNGKGLEVINQLYKEDSKIKINVTGLMTREQALLAWMAGRGPAYLSLFFNRIRDGGGNPEEEIGKTRNFLDLFGKSTEIITGSIRKGDDVYQAMVAGTHIVTVTPEVIMQMIKHPKSVEFIEQCQAVWNNLQK